MSRKMKSGYEEEDHARNAEGCRGERLKELENGHRWITASGKSFKLCQERRAISGL